MKTNVITVEGAMNKGTWKWNKLENDVNFNGVVPGYICGWCVEIEKDNKVDYCSCTFTNDYEEIRLPEDENGNIQAYNDLGISTDLAMNNGWTATGNIVFRGYFKTVWDSYYGEEGYVEASKEVA